MENKSKISERLKELRNKKGMTQEELAQKINTSRSNIANYETGKNNPSVEMLEKLSEIFNCSMDYLMGRADLKTTEEYLKDVDLTSVYLDGVYDGEKKWKDKIKAKIEELEDMYNKLSKNPKEHLHSKTEYKIVIGELQSLLEKEDKND